VCSVIGVVATASVVWWSGGYASGAAATAFVVIGMLGFQGLSLRGALALAATIGAAYGAVLVTQHGNVAPFERWMVTMALVVAGGMMARWFVNLVPEKARNEHRARTAAEDANAELVRVTQQYRDTLAHVSHELRTPLNAIIGFAEVLRSNLFGELTDAQRAQVEDIVDAGRELLAFVNDILELSRIEAGRVAVEIGPASMSDVVSAAVVRDTPGPNIVADLDPEAEDIVADARRLAQALGAVVSVAASATPRGGQIRLTSHQGPNGFVVRVSDDGPAAARDGARGEVAMLLATRLTELQGGRVTVTASGSGGTTVSIEIPRRERSEASLGNVT
jgi:signal transduction histidine kinase